jgi:hypothetical protein
MVWYDSPNYGFFDGKYGTKFFHWLAKHLQFLVGELTILIFQFHPLADVLQVILVPKWPDVMGVYLFIFVSTVRAGPTVPTKHGRIPTQTMMQQTPQPCH